MEQEIRKLKKVNRYSYSLIIPKEFVERYEWKEHQKLVIRNKGRGVLEIRDWRRR